MCTASAGAGAPIRLASAGRDAKGHDKRHDRQLDGGIGMPVQAWRLEQILRVRRDQLELVDAAMEDVLELQDRFIAPGVPPRIGAESVVEAEGKLAAIESWNAAAQEAGQV
jgi:hypothetical protein